MIRSLWICLIRPGESVSSGSQLFMFAAANKAAGKSPLREVVLPRKPAITALRICNIT